MAASHAAVFGDGNAENGIEDARKSKQQADYWPKEFAAVGRIICDGQVQGTGILIDRQDHNNQPAPHLLTAHHVVGSFQQNACVFSLESDLWRQYPLRQLVRKGVGALSASLLNRYDSDWVLFALEPFDGWRRYALKPQAVGAADKQIDGWSKQAFFVSFDAVIGKISAHFECRYGLNFASRLLQFYPELFWDDCDSSGGSSGGALFVRTDSGYQLIGMRVGSLFDETLFGQPPDMGASFNLHTNINVSKRLVDLF